MANKLSENPSAKIWLSLFILYIGWGSTYLAIHNVVLAIPPILASGLRNFIAGLAILLFTLFSGKAAMPTMKQLVTLSIPGILMLSLGNGLLTMAAKWVPSGYMSLFPALVPAWIVLLQWILGERPKPITMLGLLMGFVGLFILINKAALSIQGYEQYFGLGVGLLLAATIAWSLGVIYSIHRPLPFSVAYVSAMQMIIGGLFSLLMSALYGEWPAFSWQKINQNTILSFGWLLLVGSILGFLVFTWVSKKASPALVSTYAYVNPLVALFLGWLMLGEELNQNIIISSMLIVAAVFLVTWGSKAAKEPS